MSNLVDIFRYLRQIGPRSSCVLMSRRILGKRSRYFTKHRTALEGTGLEVAGPSSVFMHKGYYPVYSVAKALDNVNYSAQTRWHGDMGQEKGFQFDPKKMPGRQIINEAGNLADIRSGAYDFLISNHMLEHSANPIRVLLEWKRVVKDNGLLLIALPHKDGTFDHRRPVTELSHLIADYENDTGEDDTTHIGEILELHDCARDYSNNTKEKLAKWLSTNLENRCAHQHVFNAPLAAQLADHAGFEILDIEISLPSDIYLILRKPNGSWRGDGNAAFLGKEAAFLKASPFPSDKP